MANRTVKDATTVKGTNPQYLIEKIIRTRIYESKYWKEECFALSAELIVDKAMELKYIGGVFGGNIKVSPFLCLILKMLQIQPEKDIVVEFIAQQDFKYVRALGAIYMRLTGSSLDCYKYLEPLYLDYRKLKRLNREGNFELVHMDEFIDELLHEERVFDTILPRIQKRHILEDNNQLEPRVSALIDDDVEDMDDSEEEGEFKDSQPVLPLMSLNDSKSGHYDWDKPRRSASPRYRRSRSPHRRRGGSKERGERESRKDRDRDREKHRRRSRSRERRHKREDREDGEGHHHRSKKRRDRDMDL